MYFGFIVLYFMTLFGTDDNEQKDEAQIQKEVETHEKRIRKEIERQDILRRKVSNFSWKNGFAEFLCWIL